MLYGGIGARQTPSDILSLMTRIARKLECCGWTLRSGGADGADMAFEKGVWEKKEIYRAHHATPESIELASHYHPMWDKCSDYAKKLHGRNNLILLGVDLKTPVKMVVCWTRQAQITGGTGQGIRVAHAHGIPVKNLADLDTLRKVKNWLGEGNNGL